MSGGPDPGVEKHSKIPWGRDGSMRILVNWLRAPGNYNWQGGFRQAGKMQQKGPNLRRRLFEWPDDDDLHLKIKKRCPQYRELLPVFRSSYEPRDSSPDTEDTTNVESEEQRQAASQDDLASSPDTEVTNVESLKKRQAASQDHLASSKRRRPSGPVDTTETQSGGASVSGRIMAYGLQYSLESWRYGQLAEDVQQPVACSPEMKQRIEAIMADSTQRRADVEVEARKKEANLEVDLRIRALKVQAMHQMKNQGIPDDDLNRHFLPETG
ncbi:hypothetical protein PR003_g21731 [Phytophthora rubi]|uniref:Uncharacterized protein n=1 Tax=Phytophthora rubi TaxID=129364 RepID=A0A6A3JFE8_9STRA|nr:hypothetical protein PR002_g21148 [Phytophthora rubi]KAE8993540.1 hypothetical protein PR001_g20643 [Phytophthora rubi]KAE9304526.1 hypothetical protein PR003_g21731 [Phytophthora rubi]